MHESSAQENLIENNFFSSLNHQINQLVAKPDY